MLRTSNSVMIDPSLLFAQKSAEHTFNLMANISESERGIKFYLSKTLIEMIQEIEYINTENFMIRFYLANAEPIPIEDLKRLLADYSEYFHVFEKFPKHAEKHAQVVETLSGLFDRKLHFDIRLLSILFEEWIFLQEYSWITARIKVAFVKFKEAGAMVIELGKKSTEQLLQKSQKHVKFRTPILEKLIRKTLKKKETNFIRRIDMLRAFGKWIAVGGSPIIGLFNPTFGGILSSVSGVLILLDPEEANNLTL